jgi:hypothetical protein
MQHAALVSAKTKKNNTNKKLKISGLTNISQATKN